MGSRRLERFYTLAGPGDTTNSSGDNFAMAEILASVARQTVVIDLSVLSESSSLNTGSTGFDRSTLVIEQDRPTIANTGELAPTDLGYVARTAYTDSYTVTTPGKIIENKNLAGFLKIQADGVIVRNCVNIGPATAPASQQALIDCSSTACTNAQIIDTRLEPQVTSRFINGMQGGNFTADRLYIRNVVDYFSIYAGNGTTDPLNVKIRQCLGDGMHGESPDSTHTDNVTHNDGVQIQGGSGPCLIQGNDFYAGYYNNGSWTQGSGGLAAPDRGTGDETNGRYQNNLGFAVIQYTAIGSWFPHSATGALIETKGNWIRGGNRGINAGSAVNVDIGLIRRNKFDDNQGIRASLARGGGHTLNMDPTTTADTGDGTSNANVYMSSVPTVGGQEVTVRRNQ